MKPQERIIACEILLTLVAACAPHSPPTATPTPAPLISPTPTPGETQSDVQVETSQAQTELPPALTALAATQREVQVTPGAWPSTSLTQATVPPPTATPAPPTATPAPPTPAPDRGIPFYGITMFDTMQGWASGWTGTYPYDVVHRTWRTSDGGLTWQAVTPAEGDVRLRYALNGQVAWVTVCTPVGPDCRDRLLRTLDSGATWEGLSSPYVSFDEWTHFFNERDGYIYSYGVAAGSGWYQFRETHDGGATWKAVAFITSHQGGPADDPFGYHVCNICGDVLYLDFKRMLVAGGGDPPETLPVWITLNRGATWHRTDLVPPSKIYESPWNRPIDVLFFPDSSALLAISLTTEDFSQHAVAFYGSSDGGFTWSLRSVVDLPAHTGNLVDAPIKDDVFLDCGPTLCVSHDGARSWRQLATNLSFDRNGSEPFVRTFQFVDADRGWALVGDETLTLWHTMDGGVTWTMLDPILLP